MKSGIKILVCLFLLPAFSGCSRQANVLIYTKNGKGYVHKSIPASVECLKSICEENNWKYEATDDAAVFSREKIDKFDVLVFSNTNNKTFDTPQQRDVFVNYIRKGGGFVGIHSANASERDWPWFWANVGGKFVRHAKLQQFDIKVIDKNHPSTAFLPDIWTWEDECYYTNHFNPDIHVLLAADLTTVEDKNKDKYPAETFDRYFPLCWYHTFDGGKQWYTALGHKSEYYKDENFKRHLEGGIRWVLSKRNK